MKAGKAGQALERGWPRDQSFGLELEGWTTRAGRGRGMRIVLGSGAKRP